ncbi:MAG: TetR/AcrR family transcriptional regulator [Desulfobacteraceae bacterium]|nr:TetR/AcrR family transcriptional regulator [Desulfobacteraceae bacterium]
MPKNGKPFGRDEVVDALICSASELFGKHGVAGVSIRQIAARAGVNHSQVCRHFGSKDGLRRVTQEKMTMDVLQQIGKNNSFEEAVRQTARILRKNDSFWRVMARTLLEEDTDGNLQQDYPFIREMIQLAKKDQEAGKMSKEIEPKTLVAGLMAFGFGLQIFEKYIIRATELDKEPEIDAKVQIFQNWLNLVLKK